MVIHRHTLYITSQNAHSFTYDHRIMRIRLPVRSAIYKHDTGALVLGWVTTGEYALLYVFAFFFRVDGKKKIFFGYSGVLVERDTRVTGSNELTRCTRVRVLTC